MLQRAHASGRSGDATLRCERWLGRQLDLSAPPLNAFRQEVIIGPVVLIDARSEEFPPNIWGDMQYQHTNSRRGLQAKRVLGLPPKRANRI